MDNNLQKIIDTLKQVTLSTEEKSRMRANVFAHASNPQPIKSPFWKSWMPSRQVFAGSLALLLVVGSGGVALAAQNTLPGDPLYAIKVNVNENIGRLLAKRSPQTAVAYEASLMNTRLAEAEKLDAQGKLQPQNALIIKKEIDNQEQRVSQAVASLVQTDEPLIASTTPARSEHVRANVELKVQASSTVEEDQNTDSDQANKDSTSDTAAISDILKQHKHIIDRLNHSEDDSGSDQ